MLHQENKRAMLAREVTANATASPKFYLIPKRCSAVDVTTVIALYSIASNFTICRRIPPPPDPVRVHLPLLVETPPYIITHTSPRSLDYRCCIRKPQPARNSETSLGLIQSIHRNEKYPRTREPNIMLLSCKNTTEPSLDHLRSSKFAQKVACRMVRLSYIGAKVEPEFGAVVDSRTLGRGIDYILSACVYKIPLIFLTKVQNA